MTEPKNGYVRWQIFVWAMIIFAMAMGWVFVRTTESENKVDDTRDSVSELKANVDVIKNDVGWIKNALQSKNQTFYQPSQIPIVEKP